MCPRTWSAVFVLYLLIPIYSYLSLIDSDRLLIVSGFTRFVRGHSAANDVLRELFEIIGIARACQHLFVELYRTLYASITRHFRPSGSKPIKPISKFATAQNFKTSERPTRRRGALSSFIIYAVAWVGFRLALYSRPSTAINAWTALRLPSSFVQPVP